MCNINVNSCCPRDLMEALARDDYKGKNDEEKTVASGRRATIRNIASVLGEITDKAFERVLEKAEALDAKGDDATNKDTIELQGEVQIAKLLSDVASNAVKTAGQAAATAGGRT